MKKGKPISFFFSLLCTEAFYFCIKISQVCECQERFAGNTMMIVMHTKDLFCDSIEILFV